MVAISADGSGVVSLLLLLWEPGADASGLSKLLGVWHGWRMVWVSGLDEEGA